MEEEEDGEEEAVALLVVVEKGLWASIVDGVAWLVWVLLLLGGDDDDGDAAAVTIASTSTATWASSCVPCSFSSAPAPVTALNLGEDGE